MNKISILGKILFLTLLPILTYAQVVATLDKITVLEGERATLSITARGNDITFPQLRTVEGNKVLGTSTSSSISIINGSMSRTKTVSYVFAPKYTFTVPIYSVMINGIEELTEPIKLKVVKPTSSKHGDNLQLEVKLSKSKAYVGESIFASIIFKYKAGIPLINLDLEDFAPKHFVTKALNPKGAVEKNGFKIVRQDFLIFPQLAGKYKIDKQLINVAMREPKTNMTIWQKIFSNENKLEIIPLPLNIDIQGDYSISASIDKNNINSNEPVNLTIEIKGQGNIDDISEFKLDLADEVSYSTKPEIKNFIKDGKYGGTFIQKLSIIADNNFIIKPIIFKYFDINTKEIKTIKTKKFNIKVKKNKKTTPSIQTGSKNQIVKTIQLPAKIVYKTEDGYIKYLFLFFGFIMGLIIVVAYKKSKSTKANIKPINVQIRKAKNDKELYKILLPYSYNNNILKYIHILEKNIYNNEKNKFNKKDLLEEF